LSIYDFFKFTLLDRQSRHLTGVNLKKQSQIAGLCPETLNTKLEILNKMKEV
jgi:hypothetical protein